MDCTYFRSRCALSVLVASASFFLVDPAHADPTNVDLDAVQANGDESQCELYISNPFPVEFTNKVTNKTGGDAFDFSWPSASPGGFTSSVIAGTAAGKSTAWTWKTLETVISTTGSTCATDICFTQTSGPDPDPSSKFCAYACLADASSLAIAKAAPALIWTGGLSPFTVYRSTSKIGVVAPANALGSTTALNYSDPTIPPPGVTFFYAVRGLDCATSKSCVTNANCSIPGDGACVSRGPFGVPGRKLQNEVGDVTISSGSLSASLISFFSPPQELFRAESFANAGGTEEKYKISGTAPVYFNTPGFPLGCCPAREGVPHQLRCEEGCVDYLNDRNHCGDCFTVCGDDQCCSNGSCKSLCGEGLTWHDGQCYDLKNDDNYCGDVNTVCQDGTCCNDGICESLCLLNQVWCNGQCVDLQNDSSSCGNCDYGCGVGTCAYACGDGTCCNQGLCASFCPAGEMLCPDGQCADFQNDNEHCGDCDTACGPGTCCNQGVCQSFCETGQTLCGDGQCADFQNDNDHCGDCGTVCSAGTCCNQGVCQSFCETGQTLCGDGQCADLQNDNDHCGGCGTVCGAGTCCHEGVCESYCPAGKVLCGTECVDVQYDNDHCGTCGTVCGAGTCCNGGSCASLCEAGRTYCGGLCYDTQKDPSNCGACGNVCAEDSICTGGTCVVCTGQSGAKDACDNRCVNLNTDPYNCGTCGNSCNLGCPSGFKGVCSNGQSCHCVAGTPAPPPPSNIPPPTSPSCPNPNPPPERTPGYCHGTPTDSTTGYCHGTPTESTTGYCHGTPTVSTTGYCHGTPTESTTGYCPNAGPTDPAPGHCLNTHPSGGPVPEYCPVPGPPGPAVDETVVCVVEETTQTILPCTVPPLPGCGEFTICHKGSGLFKEDATAITVCGDGIPGVDGECNSASTKITIGTFNRLVPVDTPVGNAYVTPYAVHIASDTSNDGLIAPGESADLVIDVLNAGLMNITEASATLSAPAVDLTDDGINNPVGITVGTASAAYGTIPGTAVSTNCTAPPPQPASNATVFPITVPLDHPSITGHPFLLAVSGTVNGGPFAMNVPLVIGIGDGCNAAAHTREYDGVDGLSNPMAKLVPVGDLVPFPSKSFSAGNTRPLKLRVLCGGVNLTDAMVDAPEIVGLTDGTGHKLDIKLLNLNADNTNNPNDPFFRFNNALSGGQWAYSMRTSLLGTGSFTVTIRIAGRKNYVAGFVLQ